MEKQKNSPIVLIAQNNFDAYLASVVVQSIIAHASKQKQYEVILLHTEDITKGILNTFCSISTSNVNIRTFICPDDIEPDFMFFELPYLFKKYHQIIYLCLSSLLKSDIAELYDVDLKNFAAAAALDATNHRYIQNFLGLEEYFKTSVILLDTKELIKSKLKAKALALWQNKENYRFPVQDIFNLIYSSKIKILDSAFNFSRDMYIKMLYLGYVIQPIQNIKILTYSTEKPWKHPDLELMNVWWKYARLSPFYENLLIQMLQKTKNSKPEATTLMISSDMQKQILQKSDILYPLISDCVKETCLYILTFGAVKQRHKQKLKNIVANLIGEARK